MNRIFVDILIRVILGFLGVTLVWTGIHEKDVSMALVGLVLVFAPWAFDKITL